MRLKHPMAAAAMLGIFVPAMLVTTAHLPQRTSAEHSAAAR